MKINISAVKHCIVFILSLVICVTVMSLADMLHLQCVEAKKLWSVFMNETGYMIAEQTQMVKWTHVCKGLKRLVRSYYGVTKMTPLDKTKQRLWNFLFSFHYRIPFNDISVYPSSLFLANNQRDPEEQMQYEWGRYLSFNTFPQEAPVWPLRLAQAGFYYMGRGQLVRCFSCRMTNDNWTQDETAMQVHRRLSPNCNFISGGQSNNVTIHYPEYYSDRDNVPDTVGNPEHELQPYVPGMPRPRNEPVSLSRQNSQSNGSDVTRNESQTSTNLSATTSHVKYPQFINRSARSASFEGWQSDSLIPTGDLAEAGFFYAVSGINDHVRCFTCGVGLRNWETGDDPLKAHHDRSPQCQYLRDRGESFQRPTPDLWPQPDFPVSMLRTINSGLMNRNEKLQEKFEELQKVYTCKVCLDADADIILLPFCHSVSCSTCASQPKTCGVCRSTIKIRIVMINDLQVRV